MDGYWTAITRTYCLGEVSESQRRMYEAVLAAREAALSAVRPGVPAHEVDDAARQVLSDRGFGQQFKTSTGHGIGFGAINQSAPPRLHPKSEDVLEVGMVFNIEPGIYIDGQTGLRHGDMIALTEKGPEVLTAFHEHVDELVLAGAAQIAG